ncbi:MAG: type IV secretory system conjugative DNA transfer family protein [Acidobacteria bacterium]|nr:type IV secretory system conjugative DNA transfer family protein [Acidobacteriota bacterium]
MWSQRPPEIYRTPKDPKHLGGYNWSALLFGLLLLLGANVAATQFIAWRFQYQAALGAPLFRSASFAVYQPFAWGFWVWKHGSSPQPEIRLPILGGALIVVGASTVALVLVYALNIRRTRKLSLNAEDIHGSAKWASSEDVRATGLLANPEGVYVGGYFEERAKRLYYLRHNGPEHVLAFAPTRSGKGVGLVIPTLLAWSESAVIYDIKGENWAKTAGYRAKSGHLCFKFSPVEQANGSRFNPLAEVRIGTPRDVSDAQNVADMIVRTGEDSPQERYWQDAAASITTGMILHVCYAAAAEKRVACLADLARVFTTPGQGFRDTLNGIASYIHDPMRQYNWKTGSGLRTQTHPVVGEKVQEMLDKEDKDFSGVLSTAKTALTLYSDPLVSKNTSASDFTIRDLVNHEKPVSLYLVVPPSDKIRLRPLIRLIFTMIVNRLTEKMDFEGADQKRNNHRLLFMIDEFPSLKRMEVFADALSYMAGYGLKAYLITQDIRQIVDEYGPNESIVSNCHVRAAYAPNQYDTAELLSKMTGTRTLQKASFNFSGSRLSPILNHMNASLEQVERPLMTPDEVMRLRPPVKTGDGEHERIVEPGDMLIFVAGHRPIYGKQLLYFLDPELAKRAAEKPPVSFVMIDGDGAVRAQPDIDKTPNVISAAEVLYPSIAKPHTANDGDDPTTAPPAPLPKPIHVNSAAARVRPPAVVQVDEMENAEQVRPPEEHHHNPNDEEGNHPNSRSEEPCSETESRSRAI